MLNTVMNSDKVLKRVLSTVMLIRSLLCPSRPKIKFDFATYQLSGLGQTS